MIAESYGRPRESEVAYYTDQVTVLGNRVVMCREPGCVFSGGVAAFLRHDCQRPLVPSRATLKTLYRCSRERAKGIGPSKPGVYCVGNGLAAKIGKSWNAVRERMSEGQVWSPVELQLMAVLSEDPEDERAIHEYLRGSHIRGEWFYLSSETLELIEWAKCGKTWGMWQIEKVRRGE